MLGGGGNNVEKKKKKKFGDAYENKWIEFQELQGFFHNFGASLVSLRSDIRQEVVNFKSYPI